MSQSTEKTLALPTIWVVPDPLWEIIQSILDVYDPPKPCGRAPH